MSKMYIAVLEDFPDYMTPTLVAHAILQHDTAVMQRWFNDTDYMLDYQNWKQTSFKKVVLKVTRKEFDKISQLPNVTLSHENNTNNAEKSCAVVVVNDTIPNVLKFAKLWKPGEIDRQQPKSAVQYFVGDTIKVVSDGGENYFSVGATGKITQVKEHRTCSGVDYIYLVQFETGRYISKIGVDYHPGRWWAASSSVKRVKKGSTNAKV